MRAPWARVNPIVLSAHTLLPEPDSPTIPSVRPCSSAKETPFTAFTTPPSVGNSTLRSSRPSSNGPAAVI